MKLIFFCLSVIFFSAAVKAQPVKHVILISIDGLRPEFYLDNSWPTPVMQSLKTEGLYALKVKSVFPSFTYPSHVAMLTGALPARSGIYYNAPLGSTGNWNWFIKDVRTPTIWQKLKVAGLTSSAIQWPVSVSDDITYNIPEIWSKEHPEDRITETRKYATPGLIEEIEMNATGRLDGENMNEEFLSLDANAGRMAAYIFKTYKPNLLALHFAGVDGAQHAHGREGSKVKIAIANVDRAIGDLIETIERSGLKDSTAIIITGDHGFMNIHTAIKPNLWLKENKLFENSSNWKARFQPAGGAAFLYLQNRNDQRTLEKVKTILNSLPFNQKKLFTIYDRNKLDELGADSSAAFALAAAPGIVFSGSVDGAITTPVSGGHHGYDPNLPEMYTGFIGAGTGFNKDKVIQMMGVEDIAPLIAKLLGIEFNTPDGILHSSIIKQ